MSEVDAPKTEGGDAPDGRDSEMDSSDGPLRNPFKYEYKMTYPKRGIFVIINNKTFDPKTQMGGRNGTDKDAENLEMCFRQLGFDVHAFNNQKANEMLHILKQAAQVDHAEHDCFGCAILSHGDEGVVYGTDGIISIQTLIAPFKGPVCPSLAGKPKLFFIQACRGNQLDHGIEVEDDSEEDRKVSRIPSEADFLYAYSTTPGYFSWRNSNKGSWFVQSLSKNLSLHGTELEMVRLLTRVNRDVAYEFESNASKEFMNKKKQIPSIVSMLTKELYLRPKPK